MERVLTAYSLLNEVTDLLRAHADAAESLSAEIQTALRGREIDSDVVESWVGEANRLRAILSGGGGSVAVH